MSVSSATLHANDDYMVVKHDNDCTRSDITVKEDKQGNFYFLVHECLFLLVK